MAIQPKPPKSSIWVHEQPDMRVRLGIMARIHPPGSSLSGSAFFGRENRLPSGEIRTGNLLIRYDPGSTGIQGLHLGFFPIVADEKARVDFDALDDGTGHAQLDHGPVVGRWVMAAGLPSVVPGSRVHEDSRPVDGGGWSEQVCGRREVVVGA